jgi:hypothetical protein
LAVSSSLAALLPGCATMDRGSPVPRVDTMKATVLGLANERFFPMVDTDPLEAEFVAAVQRLRRGHETAATPREHQLLAVSGGGENGAFGAGLLCGWSATGTRPIFELVTGVSTGALTAPFAYLGSAYDPQLRTVYTQLSPDDVLSKRMITAALLDDALADNFPLFRTISRYLNEEMLVALAKGYNEGRLLLISSTNLDAQQPVIWNIGAIANSGHPLALDTIRRVLLASAAVPGAFPPTMFNVTLDGKPYQEMHVDGGAFTQAFLYPAAISQERRERPLAKVLSDLREWLDAERFEPVTFRCTTENDCIICRLEFQFESEAAACAAVFNGTVTALGKREVSGPLSGQTSIGRPLP